jgi:hypothetical protein
VLKRTHLLLAGMLVAILMTALFVASARADSTAEKPTAKEDLNAAIKKGIEMLDAKKTTEFLERYMIPDDIEKMKKSGHWEEIIAEFKKDHVDDVLKVLNFVKDAKPKMSEDGETATFNVEKLEGKHPSELHFHKIKDVWYIADH